MKYFSGVAIFVVLVISLLFLKNNKYIIDHAGDKDSQTEALRTVDGRFGTKCRLWEKGFAEEICIVSFVKLIANPERYDGRLVLTTGFIINSFGTPILYMNEASYNGDLSVEGIELIGQLNIVDGIESQLDIGIFPVTVVGHFDAHYEGFNIDRLGALRDISHIIYSPRITEK